MIYTVVFKFSIKKSVWPSLGCESSHCRRVGLVEKGGLSDSPCKILCTGERRALRAYMSECTGERRALKA